MAGTVPILSRPCIFQDTVAALVEGSPVAEAPHNRGVQQTLTLARCAYPWTVPLSASTRDDILQSLIKKHSLLAASKVLPSMMLDATCEQATLFHYIVSIVTICRLGIDLPGEVPANLRRLSACRRALLRYAERTFCCATRDLVGNVCSSDEDA